MGVDESHWVLLGGGGGGSRGCGGGRGGAVLRGAGVVLCVVEGGCLWETRDVLNFSTLELSGDAVPVIVARAMKFSELVFISHFGHGSPLTMRNL